MMTNTIRQAGLAALLTCGLVLFMPGNIFAQGGGGKGGRDGGGGKGDRDGRSGKEGRGGDCNDRTAL